MDKKCDVCENMLEQKEGVSKAGKPYKGWFCPDRDCKGKPVWENTPRQSAPSVSELQKEFTMIQERFDILDNRFDKLGEFLLENFEALKK